MRIAIIGGGMSGLAVCYFLSPWAEVTLYDPQLGGGASRLAHLLNPHAGVKGLRNRWADAGVKATLELIGVAEKQLGRTVAYPTKVRGPAGLFEAWSVDAPAYLNGLWRACRAQYVAQRVGWVEGYDAVVLAAGHRTVDLWPEAPIYGMKGQILELRGVTVKEQRVGSAYLLLREADGLTVAGSTYEREFKSEEPDLELARSIIGSKLPEIAGAEVISVQAGVRAMSRNRLPIAGKIAEHRWVLTGLGSKGLLYHALLARSIAIEILGTYDRRALAASGLTPLIDDLDGDAYSACQPKQQRKVVRVRKPRRTQEGA
jgi:glycine/D-amino acid oxidase-like deaminating enzyme